MDWIIAAITIPALVALVLFYAVRKGPSSKGDSGEVKTNKVHNPYSF